MAEDNDISDREVANAMNICILSILVLVLLLVVFNFLNLRCEEISNKYFLELKVQPKHRYQSEAVMRNSGTGADGEKARRE